MDWMLRSLRNVFSNNVLLKYFNSIAAVMLNFRIFVARMVNLAGNVSGAPNVIGV